MCETSNTPQPFAHGFMLGDDAARVLHGHLVAGEWDDLGAERDVNLVKGCALERSGCSVGHVVGLVRERGEE
jgi:hypothetical protein